MLLLKTKIILDHRGSLIPVDFSMIPFEVGHAFVIEGKAEGVRGGHAHLRAKQFLICIEGDLEASILSLNNSFNVLKLGIESKETCCLYVPEKTWLDLKFGPFGGRVLVLSDIPYSEADYVRDKGSFFELEEVS